MRLAWRIWFVLGALSLGTHYELRATSMIYEAPPCGEKTERLCHALRIADPEQRAAETRAALVEAMKSEDRAVLPAVAYAIGKLKYRVDLRPFADPLGAGCGRDALRCLWQRQDGDWALLQNGSRAERIDTLERAIRDGTVKMGGGTTVQRKWAVKMAAEQGLEELRPLAEEYLAALTEPRIRKLELTNAAALFELCAGSASRQDAPRWAAKRIQSMPSEEFEKRMTEDEGFRGAVLDMAGKACASDPLFDGVAPECALIAEVARRHPKASLPPGVISTGDTCWLPRDADWRDRLWCASRLQAATLRRPSPAFEPLGEGSAPRRGDFRNAGLNPCSIPELPERRGNAYVSDVWVTLTDLSAIPPRVVDPSVGVVGHRAGESVRLGVEVTDRGGRPKALPLLVAIRIDGEGAGSLSPTEMPSACSELLLPWSDPEKAGSRLPVRRDFVVTLGRRATAAGLEPGSADGTRAAPWWRENGRLDVRVNSVDDDMGLVIPHLDETYSLRPESSPETAQTAFRRLEADFSGNDRGAILDGDMEDKQVVVRGPLRAFLVFSRREAKENRLDVVCRSVTEGSPMGRANVTARRIGDSSVFIGAFTLFPNGHPEPDTPPGRSISAPILKITVGTSNTSCGDDENP